jgi:hypothetical protein
VSIQRITCYMVTCDDCRTGFDEPGADYVVHFDTPDDALGYITECGWELTESGSPICHHCAADRRCSRDGHQFSQWHPCACRGAIPDHALFGCGLFRFCQRDGCGHIENRTLAQLPTTQEPTTPGG